MVYITFLIFHTIVTSSWWPPPQCLFPRSKHLSILSALCSQDHWSKTIDTISVMHYNKRKLQWCITVSDRPCPDWDDMIEDVLDDYENPGRAMYVCGVSWEVFLSAMANHFAPSGISTAPILISADRLHCRRLLQKLDPNLMTVPSSNPRAKNRSFLISRIFHSFGIIERYFCYLFICSDWE